MTVLIPKCEVTVKRLINLNHRWKFNLHTEIQDGSLGNGVLRYLSDENQFADLP